MTALEIILIIVGVIFIIGSFMVSEKFTASSEQLKAAIDENELKKVIDAQVRNMEDDIVAMVENTAKEALEGSKREMEKISNEKIMAVDDFSKTVMEDIEKCHSEVMFLYGMLNDKNKETKDTAELITKANKSINKKIEEANLVVERLNEQMAEINEFVRNQQAISEKMDISAAAVESLEEQLDIIERMATQFSADIKIAEENFKAKTEVIKEEASDIVEDTEVENVSDEEAFDYVDGYEEETKVANDIDYLSTLVTMDSSDILNEEEEAELNKLLSGNDSKDTDSIEEDNHESNSNERILEMSKNGMTTLEIARQLGLGVGEVQLVIDLFEGGR